MSNATVAAAATVAGPSAPAIAAGPRPLRMSQQHLQHHHHQQFNNTSRLRDAPMLAAWRNDDHHDFSTRLAQDQFFNATNRPATHRPPPSVSSADATRAPTKSSASSMISLSHARQTARCTSPLPPVHRLPSLESDQSDQSSVSEASVSTGFASNALARGRVLEPNAAGILECPTIFECPFWFLECSEVFGDEEQWRDHALSHFKGKSPPRSVQCPLCDDFKVQSDDGRQSWNQKMNHLADHHRQGHTLGDSRAEYHLIDYLWKIKVIDNVKMKELKGNFDLQQPAGRDSIPATGRNGTQRQHSYAPTYWSNR